MWLASLSLSLQERGYYSNAHSTWGLNLKNDPWRPTFRPDDLYKIKEMQMKKDAITAEKYREGERVHHLEPPVFMHYNGQADRDLAWFVRFHGCFRRDSRANPWRC